MAFKINEQFKVLNYEIYYCYNSMIFTKNKPIFLLKESSKTWLKHIIFIIFMVGNFLSYTFHSHICNDERINNII